VSGVRSISVLIATFNRAAYLRECLDSVLAQRRPADQIIVIDDGSEDDTESVARDYLQSVVYLRQDNSGKSVALNWGLEHVTSSHVCFFDDDDFMLPEALSLHCEALDLGPEAAYSYSPHLVFLDTAGFHIGDQANWQPVTLPQSADDGEIFFKTLEWGDQFLTFLQGMLIPATVVRSIAGFNDALLRGQDYDMMLRLAYAVPATDVGQATFVMRNHAGARGPARDRHSVEKRFEVWHRYDREIVLGYRSKLELADYLPSKGGAAATAAELSPKQRQDALVRRFRIMLSHGLFAEGMDDLRMVCEGMPLAAEVEAQVATVLLKATNFEHGHLIRNAIPMARSLRKIERRTGTGLPLRKLAFKGMYWSLIRSMKRKEVSNSSTLILAMLCLLK